MAQQWDEKVPGALWTSPLEQDTLAAKCAELNIAPVDTVVTAFAQHRYVVGKQLDVGGSPTGLVMLLATADDTFSLFRGRPV